MKEISTNIVVPLAQQFSGDGVEGKTPTPLADGASDPQGIPPPANAIPNLTAHGGATLKNPIVSNIYVGDYWNSAPGKVELQRNDDFTRELNGSGLNNIVKQYGAQEPTFAGSVVIASTQKKITRADVESIVKAQLAAGTVHANAEGIYDVILSPDVVLEDRPGVTSKGGLGGFHGSYADSNGQPVYYAVEVYSDTKGNGINFDGKSEDALFITESHELTEAVTDPDVNSPIKGRGLGWYDSTINAEIGDLAIDQLPLSKVFTNDAKGFPVQREWSNTDGQYEVDTKTQGGRTPKKPKRPSSASSKAIAGMTPITRPGTLAKVGHVFVIMMENQDWSNIKGNPDAAFINDVLLKQGAHTENYSASIHPSEPNYLILEAGTTLGVADDGAPRANHQSTHDHLTAYLTQAGIDWKSYQEDISGKVVPLDPTGKYAPKHNPNIYFDDNTGGENPNDAFGIAHNRPYTELAGDLKKGTEPKYSFITPNLIHDGHDKGAPLNNQVAQQDAWLKEQIPLIQASPDYQKDGAIMIIWDEGARPAHNPSGMILLSPLAKPGYSNNIAYSHASTLRTLQEIFGVGPFLGDAAKATDLSDLFIDPVPVSP